MNQIKHQVDENRFTVETDGHEAEVNYTIQNGVMHITHTGVPSEIGGRGIAGDLVKAAFDSAREQGLKVAPDCSYAASWVNKHADYQDLVS